MTVEELIADLKTLNPKLTVLLSKDEEGNRFWNIHELGVERFGDPGVYDPQMDEEGVEAVVIWP